MAKIVILGSGGFGLALAIMAKQAGKHSVISALTASTSRSSRESLYPTR